MRNASFALRTAGAANVVAGLPGTLPQAAPVH